MLQNQTGDTEIAKTVAVIPARYGSTRFPGKPLVQIGSRPMIQWVYDHVAASEMVKKTVVATDDDRIAETVNAFGGEVVLTRPSHPSGTDRVAEAVEGEDAALVVNVQGDEPLVPSWAVDRLIKEMVNETDDICPEMGTLAVPFAETEDGFRDPNNVKVVVDAENYALYFSRAAIPYRRSDEEDVTPLWHWGIYAYRRDYLDKLVALPPGRLEKCEKLEQLRALENGGRILVVPLQVTAADVNVAEDIPRVEQVLRERGEL